MSSSSPDRHHAKLTRGPVGRQLLAMTGPMILGTFSTLAFNLVDTWFISQLGARELAAISFTFPVVMLIMFVAMGLGTGAAAALARVIGTEDSRSIRRLATDALWLGLLVVSLFILIGYTTIDPLFLSLGAPPDLLPYIREYMNIWYGGMIFLVVPMIGNNLIRATGDTRRPAFIMMTAAGVNLLLDPLLIFGIGPFPALGLTGAALATVIARALTLLAAMIILTRQLDLLSLTRPTGAALLNSWRQVLQVALPSTATNIVVPVSMAVATRLIAGFGESAVAAFGAATRIEAFVLLPVTSLAMTVIPFTGQNWGADRRDRIREAYRWCLQSGLLYGLLIAVLLGALAPWCARFMTDAEPVQQALTLYLRLVPLAYCLQSVYRLTTAMMNAMDQAKLSTGINTLRMVALYIPLAWGLGQIWHLSGFFAGIALANLLSGLICLVAMRRILI